MYRFRIFATEPRQERNTPTPEEKKILNQFIKDPSLKEVIVREPLFVGVYRPVYLSEKQGCLNCHGDPQTSPWGNGKDILGYQMENWKDGKLHGVFGIISDLKLESVVADKRNKIINILLWALILTTVCLVASYYFLREPMNNISLVVEELKASGSEIEVVSSKISRSSQTLNQSSAEAASSVGVSLEALEKLINNTHEVTKISDQAYYLSLEGKKCALKGKADFSELKNKIEILQTQSHKMSEIIEWNLRSESFLNHLRSLWTWPNKTHLSFKNID
jgi:methyl-accepting chemotaxis protein